MYTNFAAQFAPEVALPPYGEWATPEEPEAGLSAPENLYDSQGTPLNYIQDQGGPREFLVPRGQPAMATAPGNSALQEQVPLRYLGLRMSTDPNTGVSANPQDLMRNQPSTAGLTPDTVVPNWGREVVAQLPPMQQNETPTQPERGRRNYPGPREILRLPGQGDPYNSGVRPTDVMEGAQNRRMYETLDGIQQERTRRNGVDTIQGEFNAGTAGGLGTLQRLIQESGFGDQLSNFISRFRGHAPDGPGRRSAPGAEMESELRGMQNLHNELSMVDTPPGNVVPTTSRVVRAQLLDFSTEQGLADFNQRMGLRLGRQVRTQAEQDNLYNRGLTPTRNSAHIGGRALDWPARQIPNEHRGRAAEQYVRDRIVAVYGEDVANQYEYQYESGRGRNQGTGPHVHIEPR